MFVFAGVIFGFWVGTTGLTGDIDGREVITMVGVTMETVLEALSSEEDAIFGGVRCGVGAVIAGIEDGAAYADFIYSP